MQKIFRNSLIAKMQMDDFILTPKFSIILRVLKKPNLLA